MTSPDQERLSAEVAPCPFCGVTLTHRHDVDGDFWDHDDRDMACIGYTLTVYPEDIPAWNRRAQAPTPEAGGAIAALLIDGPDGADLFETITLVEDTLRNLTGLAPRPTPVEGGGGDRGSLRPSASTPGGASSDPDQASLSDGGC